MLLKFTTIVIFILLNSCSNRINTLKQEHLFHLPLGIMEDEVNLFEQYGAITMDKLYYTMYNGIFYVINTPSNKMMKFSSHGDILSLIYNSDTYPATITNNEKKRIISYPFSSPSLITIDNNGSFYVQDNAFSEKQFNTSPGEPFFDNIIIKFNDKGEKLYTLGQEGINGSNFPLIHRIMTNKHNDLIVIARLFDDWKIYWFDSTGKLRFEQEIIKNSHLSKENNLYIEDIYADTSDYRLYISSDDLAENNKPKIANKQSTTLFYKDIGSNPLIPLLEKRPGSQNELTYFIGLDNDSIYYLSPSGTDRRYYYTLFVLNKKGELVSESRLETAFSPSQILPKFYLSNQNVLTAFLIHSSGVEVVWWRIKNNKSIGILKHEKPNAIQSKTQP